MEGRYVCGFLVVHVHCFDVWGLCSRVSREGRGEKVVQFLMVLFAEWDITGIDSEHA